MPHRFLQLKKKRFKSTEINCLFQYEKTQVNQKARVRSSKSHFIAMFPVVWKTCTETVVLVKPKRVKTQSMKIFPRASAYRRDGVVVRASASQSVDLGFVP